MTVRATNEEQLERAGREFVGAVAARDFTALRVLMTDDVRFRLLVPKGSQAHVGVTETVGRFEGWYGNAEELRLEASDVHAVADRAVVSYRFRMHASGEWRRIEQHVVADLGPDGRLAAIDLLCSGFLPIQAPSAERTYRFDAGDLGCAGGLAAEFRRRIGDIPVGGTLLVTARDPAAKEDLPPLARMMGHAVQSVHAPGDGRVVIAVERRR